MLNSEFTDTAVRAVIPCPAGGSIVLLSYPGLVIGVDGESSIHPEYCRLTFDALVRLSCRRMYRLIEPSETIQSGDWLIDQDAERSAIEIRKFPIPDYSVPTDNVYAAIRDDRIARDAVWSSKSSLALHCHSGAGRSGLIAAYLLVEQGLAVDLAVDRVRYYLAEAIETQQQLDWLDQV